MKLLFQAMWGKVNSDNINGGSGRDVPLGEEQGCQFSLFLVMSSLER